MTTLATLPSQAEIEALYSSTLGDQYLQAHPTPDPKRAAFWRSIAAETTPKSVLEVGCGSGGNLAHLLRVPALYGVDLHAPSLEQAKVNTHGRAQLYAASSTALPFPDASIDLVFTAGLLIHVSAEALPTVLKELGRVAAKHVLIVEYVDTYRRAIPWRGHEGVLFADRFPLEFWRHNPRFAPVWRKSVSRDSGFDRCEAALFVRREAA
jgi:SAM-dependent methyltransferase